MTLRSSAALRIVRRAVGPVAVLALIPATLGVALPVAANLHGDRLLVVTSGSMAPLLQAGDHALVRPLENGEQVAPGQVVTYRAGGTGAVTTHRVLEVLDRPEGRFLRTQGDANPDPDPDFTPMEGASAVLDEPWLAMAEPVAFAQSRAGRLLMLGPALVLLSVWQLLSLSDPPRTAARPSTASAPEPRRRRRRAAVAATLTACVVLTAGTGLAAATGSLATYTASASVGGNTLSSSAVFPACTAAASYRSAVLAATPQLYWRLDETTGTAVVDSGPGALGGTYTGGPTLRQPGALCGAGTGVTFGGTAQYASATATSPRPNAFSVQIWFRTTQPGGKLIGYEASRTGTSSRYDRHLFMNDRGQMVFGVYPDAVRAVASPARYDDGQWHMAVGTLGPAGQVLYVDGVRVALDAATTTAENYTGFWRIGQGNLNSWGANQPTVNQFRGTLDEAATYTSQLTAATVAGLWTASGR